MERADRRPIALVLKQGSIQASYGQEALNAWFRGAHRYGREVFIIDPDVTKPETLRRDLTGGVYGVVVVDKKVIDYFEEAYPSDAARENFRLVYRAEPSGRDDVFACLIGADHILRW